MHLEKIGSSIRLMPFNYCVATRSGGGPWIVEADPAVHPYIAEAVFSVVHRSHIAKWDRTGKALLDDSFELINMFAKRYGAQGLEANREVPDNVPTVSVLPDIATYVGNCDELLQQT